MKKQNRFTFSSNELFEVATATAPRKDSTPMRNKRVKHNRNVGPHRNNKSDLARRTTQHENEKNILAYCKSEVNSLRNSAHRVHDANWQVTLNDRIEKLGDYSSRSLRGKESREKFQQRVNNIELVVVENPDNLGKIAAMMRGKDGARHRDFDNYVGHSEIIRFIHRFAPEVQHGGLDFLVVFNEARLYLEKQKIQILRDNRNFKAVFEKLMGQYIVYLCEYRKVEMSQIATVLRMNKTSINTKFKLHTLNIRDAFDAQRMIRAELI